MEPLKLEIPNKNHQREYERVMDKWEALEDMTALSVQRFPPKINHTYTQRPGHPAWSFNS